VSTSIALWTLTSALSTRPPADAYSGTDDDDFRKAIAAGINIIHVSTELRVAWKTSLQRSLAADPKDVVPYKILRPVVDSVAQVVGSRLRLFNEKQTIKGAA
jgi:fructose/tagatose bisphosphate aldolase